MSKIRQIINEEIESLYSANFPEFGERLHNLDEYGEANVPPYDFTFDNISDFEVNYNFDTEDGDEYIVIIKLIDRVKRIWDMQFGIAGGTPTDVVNKGKRDKVMSTLVRIVYAFVDKFKPNALRFEPSKNKGDLDMRRYNMYMAYIKQNMRQDYFVYPYQQYIVIERKAKIVDKNIVTV
jgi:hypothetical protein